jgi:hypothetical protein
MWIRALAQHSILEHIAASHWDCFQGVRWFAEAAEGMKQTKAFYFGVSPKSEANTHCEPPHGLGAIGASYRNSCARRGRPLSRHPPRRFRSMVSLPTSHCVT